MILARIQFLAACLALAGPMLFAPVVMVPSVRAESPSASEINVVDASLDAAQRFRCQFSSAQRQPLSGRIVQLDCSGDPAASGLTDANGVVEFTGLKSGRYVLRTEFGCSHLRLWDAANAPPHAMRQLTLQPQNVLVRGQCSDALGCPHSIMWAALIAAAIAVPLAVHDAGDFPPGS